LCKSAEDAGLPFQVESLKDAVDAAVLGLHTDEADHRAGLASGFDEAALDVGGAKPPPLMSREGEEDRELGQAAAQLLENRGMLTLQAVREGGVGLAAGDR